MASSSLTPTIAQLLAGHAGSIPHRTELYVSNKAGEYLRPIPGTENISVSLDNKREHAWELKFVMGATDVFSPLEDWVKLAIDFRLGSEWVRYPLGLYRLQVPSDDVLAWRRTWALTGYSGEWIMAQDHARRMTFDPSIQGYHVPPGTGVLAACRQIIVDFFGFPGRMVKFPPVQDDVILIKGMIFDIVQDAAGTYWLAVINALLNAGGFYPLWTDADGSFATKKRRALSEEEPTLWLGQGERYENIVDGDEPFKLTRDLGNFANRIIVISNDTTQIPPVLADVVADNPANPYSTTRLGYTKSTTITAQQLVGPDEAEAMARSELSRRVAAQEEWGFQTVFDPRRGPHEIYKTNYKMRDGSEIISGNYFCHGIGMQVKPLGLMDHKVAKVFPLEEGDNAGE